MSWTAPLIWIPPFTVGLAAAVAGETAVGLLLYATPGFIRPLTLILAILLGAFALGLWTAPVVDDETLAERLRRRWLFALAAFIAASLMSGVWTARGGLAGTALTRGGGLALLAGLPLYACGALLGGLATPRRGHRRAPVGAAAAAGATAGIFLAGYVLISLFLPVSIYALCLVLLSCAAIVHGLALATEGERRTEHAADSPFGKVAVEEWTWWRGGREKALIEDGRVVGVEDASGHPASAWEGAALELLARTGIAQGGAGGAGVPPLEAPVGWGEPDDGAGAGGPEARAVEEEAPPPPAALFVGGGAFTVPRLLLAQGVPGTIDVLERNPVLLVAAQAHFGVPHGDPRLRVLSEGPQALAAGRARRYRVIVVDARALPRRGPAPFVTRRDLQAFRDLLDEDGWVVVGGIERHEVVGPPLDALIAEARAMFPGVAVYRDGRPNRRRRRTLAPRSEIMLLLAPSADSEPPSELGPLTLENVWRPGPPPHAFSAVPIETLAPAESNPFSGSGGDA